MVGDTPSLGIAGGSGWPREKRLFRDDADYERFLERLAVRVEQYHIRMYLFVCMVNHFHLVFETPQANCSKFMQSLSTAYTVYYNLRHGRHGHLLDGRFKAKLVEGDDPSSTGRRRASYLLALSRYVHLNPVQVASEKHKPISERIKLLRAWPWSSYPSYIGICKALAFVQCGPLLADMATRRGAGPGGRQQAYRDYVESGLAESDDDFKVVMRASPRSIGGDGFRSWIDERYQKRLEKHARPEDASFRHVTEPLPASAVLEALADVCGVDVSEFRRRRRDSSMRAIAARQLIHYAGYSQREVAATLGVGTGSAVGKQLAALTGKLARSRELQDMMKRVELRLRHMKENQHATTGERNSR